MMAPSCCEDKDFNRQLFCPQQVDERQQVDRKVRFLD